MAIRNKFHRGVSASAFAIAMIGGLAPASVLAQTTQPETPVADEEETQDENVLVVSGFRESLQTAVAEKKRSNLILESVTAEDIGKLPDNSIGESIARLPGVTSQRLNGRANVIAIRGFGPDFSQTLLNGREQTSTGDVRAVEFDQYPAEVVNQVVVYKSPSASLVGQGLVGTIDVRTIRPLDLNETVIAVGARGSWADIGALNSGSEEYGYRANATYVDQFADDTIGIALSASYTDEPYQLQEFNAWGYAGSGTTADPSVIGGSKSYVTSTQLKRLGLTGTLQWEPAPNWMVTLDGFYSDFDDDQSKRGIELPLGFSNPYTATTVDDGFVSAGTFNNVQGVVRNDVFQRQAELFSGGLNLEYEGDDGWSAMFDFGYSRTDRSELSIESYSGTGFGGGNGAADTIGFTSGETGTIFSPTLDYSDPSLIVLTDPLGWGGGVIPQAGYQNNRIIDDELAQFRVAISKEIYSGFLSSVDFGLNYTSRQKSLLADEAFVRLPGGATEVTIPSQYLLDSTDLTYLGLGPIVSYDARQLIADGILVLEPRITTGPGAAADVLSKNFDFSEKLMTAFLQANIEQELGSNTLTGNFGVQAINTVQKSTGLIFPPTGPEERTDGADYWDVLPSLNLALRLSSDTVIRFAAAREIMRPRIDDMRLSTTYGIDTTVPGGLIRGSSGNPELRPYRANAFDLNIEQYFGGSSGVISLQLFYKDIQSFIFTDRVPFDYGSFPAPTGAGAYPMLPNIGTIERPTNTGGGKLYGAEAAVTLPFDVFTQALSGFGVTGGVGYTKSEVEDQNGNITTIPGYSEWVANGTLFFEKGGFDARGSVRYRSEFLGDFTGFGGTPTRRTALGETIVDAQIGYDFETGPLNGLSIYVQGQNLTDERFASIGANRQQVVDYQIYGRRFLAGFTYKFR